MAPLKLFGQAFHHRQGNFSKNTNLTILTTKYRNMVNTLCTLDACVRTRLLGSRLCAHPESIWANDSLYFDTIRNGRSPSRPGPFTRKSAPRNVQNRRLGGHQTRCGRLGEDKSLLPVGNESTIPRASSPRPSRCTD